MSERRDLRRRSPLHIAVADRLYDLNVDRWRRVTQGHSLFHSAAYLRMLEHLQLENIEPRYALISRDDEPVAAVCMQIARMDLRQVGAGGDGAGKLDPLRARVQQRLLVCGNLLAYGLHGVCFAGDADRASVWAAVTEVLYRVRRAEKIAGNTDLVLIKDLDARGIEESAVLGKLSYGCVPTEPNMVLALDPSWRTHADYLNGLTSKFRSDIKNRVYRKFAEAGGVVEVLGDVTAHADELHGLYLAVQANAKLRPYTLPGAYWPGLAATGGADVVFHVARVAGRIVGFIASLRDGPTAYAYHIGFDRQAADAGLPVYLRLLHASVEQAIAFGCREISFGRTALEPKARLGCTPRDTYVWARHRHPMINQLVQPLLRLIDPAQAPDISPFKAARGESA